MSETYETLRTWIIRGVLEPGQRLLETQLAEMMGISRTPIREAMRRLEIEGLIQFAPNRGAVVRSYSIAEIKNIFSLRVLLEGYSAQQAAYHRSEEHCQEILSLNQQFRILHESVKSTEVQTEHVDQFVEMNGKFHRVIWQASDNPQLPYLLERLIVIPLIYRSYDQYSYEQMANSLSAHETIGRAIIERDPVRAEIAMKEHIFVGRDHAYSVLK